MYLIFLRYSSACLLTAVILPKTFNQNFKKPYLAGELSAPDILVQQTHIFTNKILQKQS